jgi:hypothetical protein
MAGQFCLRFRLPRKPQGSFTCRKAATWDRRFYFPSEGRHAVDFSPKKSDGFGRIRTPDLGYQKPPKPPLLLEVSRSNLSAWIGYSDWLFCFSWVWHTKHWNNLPKESKIIICCVNLNPSSVRWSVFQSMNFWRRNSGFNKTNCFKCGWISKDII